MARDGRISIAIDVDGKDVGTASDSLKGLEKDAKKVKGGTDTATRGIKDIVVSLGLVKIGTAAFNILANSMDAAISRFDTFQTFPKVMDALGESAEASQEGIDKLSDGIDGLPTKLDDIVSVTQRMYTSFNNLDDATDTALALNNALLASGASAADASRGTDQYIQGLQKGKFEMEEWKTLQETMTIGLFQIADSFGMTERELKSALDSGIITMDEFNNRMIELGTGSGTLAALAKENSKGIATSLSNLRNTASRGLADILTAFNDLSIEVSGSTIAEHIDSMKVIINSAFKSVGNTIRGLAPTIALLSSGLGTLVDVIQFLSPLLIGLATAYTALMIINKINDVIDKNTELLAKAAWSGKELTIITNRHVASQAARTTATITDTTAQLANNGAITIGQAALGVLTGNIKLSTVALALKTKAVTVLSGALKVLTGPIGWVVGGIGLLVAAGAGLIKWMNRSTNEGKKLAKQTEELGESTSQLTSEVETNHKSFEKQLRQTEATSRANSDLIAKVEKLTSMENMNSKQKKELKETIDVLNRDIEGLNVAYDEEARALNMSTQEMQKRVDIIAEQDKYTAAQERQLEISKEQHEVDLQLKDTNALRELYLEQLNEGTITNREYRSSIEELNEQEKLLNETLEILSVQYGVTEEAMSEAIQNEHALVETLTGEQIILYEALSESLQQTVDSMKESYQSLQEAATNAFSKIETDTEHTMASMIETLKHNQEVVEQWGENQAKVIKWAGENGYASLIPYIESMTIDSAAELAVLAGATDSEMEKFAKAMEDGGATGKSAFLEAHQMSEEDFNAVRHLVEGTATALTTEIEAADFSSIGGDVTKGLTEGIEQGKKEAVDATGQVADDMIEKTRATLQTHSPSKVFTDIGEDTTDGLALGVKKNINTVLDAVRRVASQMPPVFANTPQQFRSIGQQAMNGLVWGLNNGRSRVMSTARNIANSVTKTMQDALKINSPSGVMRDDVGHWVPEGVAEGIDENTGSVFDSLRRMYDGMLDFGTPELALGVPRLTNNSSMSQVINQSTNYDDSNVISLLRRIADKDTNAYFDGDDVTDKVAKKMQEKTQKKGRKYNL